MLMPVTDAVGLKKSKRLLLLMMLLMFAWAEPILRTHLVGRLVPAGPMLLPITILLLFPAVGLPVLNWTTPPLPADPRIVLFASVSFCAPLMKRTVLIPKTAETVVLVSVS